MAGNISTGITTLYNAGARHIIVPNLPALGDKPSFVGTANQAFANDIVASYNPKLAAAITSFSTAHPDATVTAWDVYTQFQDMLSNPGSYGFTNTTVAALNNNTLYPGVVVADPNSHVFWDETHPTAAGHLILGTKRIGSARRNARYSRAGFADAVDRWLRRDVRSTRAKIVFSSVCDRYSDAVAMKKPTAFAVGFVSSRYRFACGSTPPRRCSLPFPAGGRFPGRLLRR